MLTSSWNTHTQKVVKEFRRKATLPPHLSPPQRVGSFWSCTSASMLCPVQHLLLIQCKINKSSRINFLKCFIFVHIPLVWRYIKFDRMYLVCPRTICLHFWTLKTFRGHFGSERGACWKLFHVNALSKVNQLKPTARLLQHWTQVFSIRHWRPATTHTTLSQLKRGQNSNLYKYKSQHRFITAQSPQWNNMESIALTNKFSLFHICGSDDLWAPLNNTVSVHWRCWLGGRKGIRPVKNWMLAWLSVWSEV